MKLLEINNDKCKICYSCVRVCPVRAIIVDVHEEYPQMVHNRCIGCGSCYTSCSPGAISYYDSKEEAMNLIRSGEKVAAIVAPSISGEFSDITDYRKFVEMIRKLGFAYVSEVSFGVDLVAQEYTRLVNNFNGKYYLSTNCPAIVSYIEKFHPDLIANLAPIVSPMIATAKVIHQQYGADTRVVFIGPCIATKTEALRYDKDGKVDVVLTFQELRQLFQEHHIHENMLEFSDFDPPIGYKGSLYPISNGILQAAGISEDLMDGSVITVEGRNSMIAAVKEFENHLETIKRHFNIFYDEGCLMGPGTSPGGEKLLRRTLVTDYANKRLKHFDKRSWEKEVKSFGNLDLSRGFVADDQRLPFPREESIAEVMRVLGREENEDLGCMSCGYESCRDFAVSVAKGLTKTDMCVTFTLRNRQEYIKTLKITNEKLAKIQDALKESERIALKEKLLAQEASATVSAMLQKLPSSIVIVDDKLKIIQANRSFIQMLGEDAEEINAVIPGLTGADIKTLLPYNCYNLFSYVLGNGEEILNRDVHFGNMLMNISVFTIRKNKIVGAVIRDMYSPEIRKEEVIKRVTEVIDKNLSMVQQIGFLLGEGASETEQMLNSILELYKTQKKDKS